MCVEIEFKKIPGMLIPVQIPIDDAYITAERGERRCAINRVDRDEEPRNSRGKAITSGEGRIIQERNDALMSQEGSS